MEMRLRAPVTRGYLFLLGALRLVNAASPRNIDQKKLSSGTQGTNRRENGFKINTRDKYGTHLSQENFILNQMVIYTVFFTIGDFPIQLCIHHLCKVEY